ncbi:poly(ADP-ribose) polymerase [Trifolium repens]|nr:poly(ADP-ribose) polymerase [Trifolium repens]
MIGLTRTILFSIQRLAYGWKRTTVARKKNLQLKKVLVVLREKQPQKPKLEPRIAKFISLVCNLSMMNQQMMEIGYNANKLPLGKLSKSTIFKVILWMDMLIFSPLAHIKFDLVPLPLLKRLSDAIDRFDMNALEQLSGEFCTLIPHEFGFKKMHEFVIDSDTPQKLKRKLEMVEALAEIEVATKLLKDDAEMQGDPLYAHYQWLHCELVPVEFGTEEFSMARLNALGSFLIQRIGCFCGMVLGSQTGLEFYCHPTPTAADGVLLLCEVALGEMAELLTGKHDADCTKGEGAIAPDFSKARELEDGLIVRLGKPKRNTGIKGSLWHNEYIVYNVDQIRMRYVANVKFKFKNRS